MHVEFVIPAWDDRPYFVQTPIGVLYAAATISGAGREVTLRDERIAAPGTRGIVNQTDIHVLATTDYDTAQCYHVDLLPVVEEVKRIRKASSAPILLVGGHGTVAPEETLSITGADFVLRGEHEVVIPESILRGLPEDRVYPARGVRAASQQEIASLPMPAYEIAPMQSYFAEGVVPETHELRRLNSGLVFGNRGCPYRCSFCHLFFGQKLRPRPARFVVDEIETQKKLFGIKHYFFLDYTFTLDTKWVRELCQDLMARGLDVFWTCQTRCEQLDHDLLALMRRAGCTAVWLGVESPDHSRRSQIRKDLHGNEIADAISMLRRHDIEPLLFMMVGFPDETPESLLALNEWLESTNAYYALSTLQPRVGTLLFDEVIGPAGLARDGWHYLDSYAGRLGMSDLSLSDVSWFLDYHDTSPRRVVNATRSRDAA